MTPASAPAKSTEERLFLGVIVVLALVLGGGGFFLIFALNQREKVAGIKLDHPRHLVNFSLTDRTGRTITRADLAGKILVVDFLFTSCSLTCPEVNRRMAEIQQRTANQPDVRLVSLTVDPRTDTPAALMKFGERFGADTNRWLMLTGDKTTLYQLIGTSFLSPDLDDPFSYMPGNFSHTERIAVVDARGQVREFFDGLRGQTTEAVLAEIASLHQ